MTDREKAIVMAYTGVCMLAENKFRIFHEYVEDIMGRPVQTIEMGMDSVADEIKEKALPDFLKLCEEDQEPCENVPDINDGNIYECPCGYGWNKSKVVRHHFCPNCGRAVDGSIKTEQEPCEDCIRRSDVGLTDFEIIMCNGDYREGLKILLEKIAAAPSVTPMQKWIPVSERLPEIHQDVILSLRSLDVEVGYRAETEPYFYCHGADGCYIDPKNVLAWMPLPKPYQPEIQTRAEGSEE